MKFARFFAIFVPEKLNFMKNLLITTLLFVLTSIEVLGQIYEIPKRIGIPPTLHLYCCYWYSIAGDGYYHYVSYNPERRMYAKDYFNTSEGNERFFCYIKENNTYYFYTDNIIGFYCPKDKSLAKDLEKQLKKSKVRNIKKEELPTLLEEAFNSRNDVYSKKNDSIAEVKKVEREKFVKDSIEAAKKEAREMDEYRRTHNWRTLDVPQGIYCYACSKLHDKTTFKVLSISADSIFYLLPKPDITIMGYNYHKIHYCVLTQPLKDDAYFKNYLNIWRDSIANNNNFSGLDADLLNIVQFNEFKDNICKEAPNGFIDSWGWRLNSVAGIEPHFTYFNTSKKTIKYVDFYFSVYNAVGDRCYLKYENSYVGSVRGVGPIETFDSGTWNWDRATHYTSADASEMKIIKLVITYMDGTSKTIPENSIKYN